MKRVLALALTAMMTLSAVEVFALEPNEPITTEEEFQEILDEIEYEPNPDYDKYTVIYYYLEDISADMYCMVSAKEDDSEFFIEVFWYGVDDLAIANYDGENVEVTKDQSGFMTTLVPDMIELALSQKEDMWKPINEEAETENAEETKDAEEETAETAEEAA